MKKIKTYFSDIDDEFSHSKKWLLEEMKECEITELKVNEAKRVLGGDFFFCETSQEIGAKGWGFMGCGIFCVDYKPRNGKSGCCKHMSFCYEPGREYLLTIDGRLTEIK